MQQPTRIHLVVQDADACAAAARLVAAAGYEVRTQDSIEAFLDARDTAAPTVLVCATDALVAAGLDVAAFVAAHARRVPVVLLGRDGDLRLAVRSMKAGAVDYLAWPARDAELLAAVRQGAAVATAWFQQCARHAEVEGRVARLTTREREVFELLLAGKLNKQIAALLDSQEATVKVHRSRLMRKLEVRSLADVLKLGHVLEAQRIPPAVGAHAALPAVPAFTLARARIVAGRTAAQPPGAMN